MKSLTSVDVIIIGAGAAGLMCGIQAGTRGRKVLILDKTNKPGKKILMSGGGRCNFTNIYTSPEQYISHNKHFCKSALSRYTPADFIGLIEQYNIAYYEKTLGQLFCVEKASAVLDMLLDECKKNAVTLQCNQKITRIEKNSAGFLVCSNEIIYQCESLVIATGGLSIPTLGSSPFGYQIAQQFGLKVYPTRAGLVPFTLHTQDKQRFDSLTGISVEARVDCHAQSFQENMLFTHRGLSGPVMLQISSYWHPGDTLDITCLPHLALQTVLQCAREESPQTSLKTVLGKYIAKRVLSVFYSAEILDKPMKQFTDKQLREAAHTIQQWSIKPNATEGYRTAEVTLGGVDCDAISSQRFEAKNVPGLFFIGEVLDVTGWLGGYNFQWAWSSGWAAGQVV